MSTINSKNHIVFANFQQRLLIASSDEERMKIFREMVFKTFQNPSEFLDCKNNSKCKDRRKNISASKKLLDEADLYVSTGLLEEALNLFTRSIATMPFKYSSLGLVFASRSIALQSMGKLKECLADIDRAFSYGGYTEYEEFKLRLRQAQCYRDLGQSDEADQSFKIATEIAKINKEEIESYREFLNSKCIKSGDTNDNAIYYPNFPEISSNTNKFLPGASDAINVAFSDLFGRHVIAASDLLPGDVIIAEESFAATLNPQFWWTHCCHCMRRSLTLIPCPSCTWAMFCSEECYDLAFTKYHSVECEVVTRYLQNNGEVDTSELLTLRIIASIGLGKLVDNDSVQSDPSSSLFFELISHDSGRCFEELSQACFIALNMTKCFRGNVDTDKLAGLILRIFLIKDSNAHTLVEIIKENNLYKTVKLGSGIFLTSSLVNHSCDPNVFRVNYCNTLVHRASRFIKKGTQLMISYGVQFDKMEKFKRQDYLKKYYFDCNCVACSENWPLKLKLPLKPSFQHDDDTSVQQKYLQIMKAKEEIIRKGSLPSNEDACNLNMLNLKIIHILSTANFTMNQVYVEVEFEIKNFYRKMTAVTY